MNIEAIKLICAGTLNSGWGKEAAEDIVSLASEYNEHGGVAPAELPPPPSGMVDPLETYCRAHAASSASVQLELLLPSAWVHVGAVGQGGWWCTWNGRASNQVVPMIDHHIGLAESGAGKTTTQKIIGKPFGVGMAAGVARVKELLKDLALFQRSALTEALESWEQEVQQSPNPDAGKDLAAVRNLLRQTVDTVSLGATRRTGEASGGAGLSDATVESIVSLASEIGGAVFIAASEQDIIDNLTRYSAAGSTSSLSVLTQGWDGEPYARMRRGTGVEDVPSLVLSLSLLTQVESFAKTFVSPAGMTLLDKGVLGRAWLTRGPEISQESVAAQELARYQDAVDGVEAPEEDAGTLALAMSRIGQAGAKARALRAIEGRLASVALADKQALGLSDRALEELHRVVAHLELLPGRSVSAHSIATSGNAGGLEGVVLHVSRASALVLESLFTLCKMVAEDDPILAAGVTRYVSHVVRVAGIRCAVANATSMSEDEWQAWLLDGEIGDSWVQDTATRVCAWWLRQHVSVTSALRGEVAQVMAREAASRETRIADASLEGLAAVRLVQNGVALPQTVGRLADKLASWGGILPDKDRKLRRQAFTAMFMAVPSDVGSGEDAWFVRQPAVEGKGWDIAPGPRYLNAMKARAAG